MRRRALLASIGVATSVGAGCLSGIEDRLSPSVQLGWFGAHNHDTESHLFDLQVVRDGAKVHESSHEIESRDGNHLDGVATDCEWGSTPGEYTVRARVDGNDWAERPLTEYGERADCVVADAQYRSGGLEFFVGTGCDREYEGMCSFTK